MTILPAFLLWCTLIVQKHPYLIHAARFAVSGPILTITVKDPLQFIDDDKNNKDGDESEASYIDKSSNKQWIDLSSIRPNIQWNVYSRAPPLPNWFPALKSIKGSVGYQYNDVKRLPSWIEGTAKLALPGHETSGNELQIQPSYEVKTGRTNLLVQANQGASYLFAQLSNKQKMLLELVRASVLWNLPSASLSSIRVTPSIDIIKKDIGCIIEAVTGGAGKTRAVLNLEYDNPTLSILYSPNDRNLLSPQISLYTADIIYQWQVLLGSDGNHGSFVMKVDPISDIHVTWTDETRSGGSWITDVRIPLEGTTLRSLAADVRVRRQFKF